MKPLPPEWFVNYGTNAEMRWDAVPGLGYKIPNERFFVRDHTATPVIDVQTWQLEVFGSGLAWPGDRTLSPMTSCDGFRSARLLAFDRVCRQRPELLRLAAGHAGTGHPVGAGCHRRRPLARRANWGRCWSTRGSRRQAVDVKMRARPRRRPSSRAASTTDRSDDGAGREGARRRAARAGDDGEPLPPDQAPVRLVVPGWIGVANIKWVGQIEVSERAAVLAVEHAAERHDRRRLPGPAGGRRPDRQDAWELARGADLPADRRGPGGRAWSGTSPIHRVDSASTRGGTWTQARLNRRNGAWVRFRYTFPPRPAGPFSQLWARATDAQGRTQEPTVPFNNGGYLFGAIVRHPVVVI